MPEQKITVVDSIMGSGKTTWAIHEIDSHPEKSYIYCTPLLDEIERIKSACDRTFSDPKPIDGRKLVGFNHLLEEGRDIAVTHSTFSHADRKAMELLKRGNYTLILDEAIDTTEYHGKKTPIPTQAIPMWSGLPGAGICSCWVGSI